MKNQLLYLILLFSIQIGQSQTTETIVLKDSVEFLDIETKQPLPVEKTFFSGSIYKTYAATIMILLDESGDISFEDAFKSYFPNLEMVVALKLNSEYATEVLNLNKFANNLIYKSDK